MNNYETDLLTEFKKMKMLGWILKMSQVVLIGSMTAFASTLVIANQGLAVISVFLVMTSTLIEALARSHINDLRVNRLERIVISIIAADIEKKAKEKS